MVIKSASTEPLVGETENIMREYIEKFTQALEGERNRLREQAEQDSQRIIDSAKEEADKIVGQARQESKTEADKLLAEANEKSEKILRESRERASVEAQQESTRIINETKEKAAQIIREIIESDIKRAESDFIQVTSEARSRLESERSKLVTIVKSIENIIDENERDIQIGIEDFATVITETEIKLKAVNEISRDEFRPNLQQVSDEALKNEQTERIEKQEIEHTIEEESPVKADEVGESVTEDKVEPTSEVEEEPSNKDNVELVTEVERNIEEGIALMEHEKNAEAVKVFKKVIELDPKNALAWRKKGTALAMLGRHTEALDDLERSLQLDSNDFKTWHNKATVLRNLGRKEEAREANMVEKCLQDPEPEKSPPFGFTKLLRDSLSIS